MGEGSYNTLMNIAVMLLKIVVIFGVVMLHVAYASYFERKIIGRMQARLGSHGGGALRASPAHCGRP